MALKAAAILSVIAACAAGAGQGSSLGLAQELYQRTEYRAALDALGAPRERDAAGQALAGRCWYMLGEHKKAIEAFDAAAAAEPANSQHQLWLGRTWGRRAETALPFTAPGYASRARKHFEKAVELDQRNKEAVNDLFTYYLEAPGFLGGGIDRAAALAEKIRALDPAEHQFALAQIAQRRKQYEAAEGHLRRAVELAPKQVGRLVDLARFLAGRGREADAEAAFRQADQLAPAHPALLFGRASTYIKAKRNLAEARRLLEQYLTLPLTPDDPPREEARKLLRSVAGG